MFVSLSSFVSLASGATTPGPLAAEALAAVPLRSSTQDTVDDALALAVSLGRHRPVPGAGATRDLWEALATIAAHDLGAVRAVEPHLDAVAILTQAGLTQAGVTHAGISVPDGAWGVFAAEGGGDPLTATHHDGSIQLTGTKPWCSLAGRLDHALVTALSPDGASGLYSVSLAHPGVAVVPDTWVARGLREIPSGPVRFSRVPAEKVGEPGWYLARPGFAWGGIGVAACWYGGAVGIARTVFDATATRRDPFLLAHLGVIDELLQSSRRALLEATQLIDSAEPPDGRILARRVRLTVARACEEILDRTGHALGPAPLALDADHAKRVADLQLYVRQHHAERDQASLGEALAGGDRPW